MTSKSKKIFLLLSIVVPFMAYCVYYYGMMVKNAPYKFVEFEGIRFEYGPGDSLINKYNSKTGDYQFVNNRDSLVKMNLKLNNNDLLYLHRKAADLGFWDFPANELNGSPRPETKNSLHYLIEFKYKRKTKTVLFDEAFDGPEKLKDANQRLIKEIKNVLADEEGKRNK